MSKFQIHSTDDFIILESENQTISVLCFSLTKIEDGFQSQFSRRMISFFDSFGYSYIIQVSKSSLKLMLIISGSNVGDVINKVSTLLEKVRVIKPISPYLIISPTNHSGFAEELLEAYISPLRKTSESRIIKIADKYWIFSSILFTKETNVETINYFQDLLKIGNSNLNLNSRIKKKQKNLEHLRNVLVSYKGATFEESIEFLNRLQQLSILYKNRISFTLRFHSLQEIKRSKVLFLLGLRNKQQTTNDWSSYFKLEKFIPDIQAISKRESRRDTLPSFKEIENKNLKPIKRFTHFLQIFKITKLLDKLRVNKDDTKSFNWFRKSPMNDVSYKIKVENININSKPTSNKPLIPYGKEVSEKELEKLVKNIPTPPS
ncbi:hypothetical protein EU534_00395 [Candidatus Heimdallarchaeota archaeon]|nr:MAG: hypothetical protein EU534_00395 [Candidatus Heimdallarchaeota archaeon]